MSKKHIILNKSFQTFRVIREAGKSKSGHRLLIVICDSCHCQRVIGYPELKRGQICICQRRYRRSHNYCGFGEISGEYFAALQRKDRRKRQKEFSVTIEQIWNLFLKQNRKCALSGMELKFESNYKLNDRTASLDRIDSSKDYTINNVQWVHKDINLMKLDHSQETFINYCKMVTEWNKNEISR